jgi:ERCC4-type nuclease
MQNKTISSPLGVAPSGPRGRSPQVAEGDSEARSRRSRPPKATVKPSKTAGKVDKDTRYVVIKDTREKEGQGWIFRETDKCAGMVRSTMKTGDYTLNGYETTVCIERKGTITEFAGNICQKRFWRELERMKDFAYAALILEFTEDDIRRWPQGSGIPKWKWKYLKVRSNFLFSSLKKIKTDFPNIQVILAGSDGYMQAKLFFAKAVEEHGGKKH